MNNENSHKKLSQNLAKCSNQILQIIETWKFNSVDLPNHKNFTISLHENLTFAAIFNSLDKKIGNCVYWFWFENIEICKTVNDLLDSKRAILKNNGRSVTAKNKNDFSRVLYVGKRQSGFRKRDFLSNISGRMYQHLGYYEKGRTGSLQLVHWIKELNVDINLSVAEVPNTSKEELVACEAIMAGKLKPMCGRH